MFRRRRPLLRAAAVGGAGYMAGKKMAGRNDGADPGYEEPAAAAPAPAEAPASGISSDAIARLKQLAELHDQGVLTDEEFNAEKQKVLSA